MDCYSTSMTDKKIVNNTFLKDCICRCCLASNTQLKPIFNSIGSIPQAIFLFTAVEIAEDDRLPGTICTKCINHLNRCINFKRKAESADCLLRKLMKALPKEGSQGSLDIFRDHDYAKPIENSFDVNFDSYDDLKLDEENIDVVSSSNYLNKNKNSCNNSKFGCSEDLFLSFKDNHEICHIQNSLSVGSPNKSVFTCSTCQDNFAVEEDLFVHSSLHDDFNGYICKSCNKQFVTFFKLKRHIPSHFQQKPIKCQVCEMRFVEMASLTRHFRVHTGSKPKSTHNCLVCKKSFPNPYSLKVHTRSHTGECPWKCDNCDKQFSDFRLLNSHKRIHDESKPYECKQCEKSFRHRSTLLAHMRIHTSSNRPYRCDQCKKAFKQSWRLRIHKRRTHSSYDTRRFLCDQCCQLFTSAASLEDHLRWHSKNVEIDNEDAPKELPPEFFQCNECSAQFSSRLDLITHQKLTHALRHECDTCFGKWKTLEELVRHKCNEALKASDEPSPDEMILLPDGQIQDCNTIVDNLLASVSRQNATEGNQKETTKIF